MIQHSQYICLFASCHLCKGAARTVLYDTQRQDYEFLPNEMYDILKVASRKYTVGQLISRFDTPAQKKVFKEYLAFLLEKEYIFLCSKAELKLFPEIAGSWESPGEISNAIIDIRENSNHDFTKIFSGLTELGCEHLQVRCFDPLPVDFYHDWLPLLEKTCIYDVELLVSFTVGINKPVGYYAPLLSYPRVSSLVIHGAPFEKTVTVKTDQRFLFIKENISGEHHCGKIGEKYFSVTLPHILESKEKNTCLHKKIAVDAAGFIRNCPSLGDQYGHISTTTLPAVVKKGAVKKLWHIHKDQVEVCRDCEFRYVCTDCRAYTTSSDTDFAKPVKCNYDPYTKTWANH